MRGVMRVLCGAFQLAMPRSSPRKWHASVNASSSCAEALCHQDHLGKGRNCAPQDFHKTLHKTKVQVLPYGVSYALPGLLRPKSCGGLVRNYCQYMCFRCNTVNKKNEREKERVDGIGHSFFP